MPKPSPQSKPASSETVRLHKYLADCGVASRRKSEALIRGGAISVNGQIIRTDGVKIRPGTDVVKLRGKIVEKEKRVLYTYFKPRHVVTTMRDPGGRTCVGDIVRELPHRVYPVGRLDGDVTGLLLLTNDGEYAEQMLHPRFRIKRTYWALLLRRPTDELVKQLERGVEVDGRRARAEDVKIIRPSLLSNLLFGDASKRRVVLQLSVREGSQHFVKKLLAESGFALVRLGRVAFGPYELRGLKPGELEEQSFRPLRRS